MDRRRFLSNSAAASAFLAASANSLSRRAIAGGLPGSYHYTPFSKDFEFASGCLTCGS